MGRGAADYRQVRSRKTVEEMCIVVLCEIISGYIFRAVEPGASLQLRGQHALAFCKTESRSRLILF